MFEWVFLLQSFERSTAFSDAILDSFQCCAHLFEHRGAAILLVSWDGSVGIHVS